MDHQPKPRKINISKDTEKKLKRKCITLLKDDSPGWLNRYLKYIAEAEFILLDDNTSKILKALLNGD